MAAGFFHTVPIIGVVTPQGTTDDGEQYISIAAENLERIQGFDDEVSKETLERFHLECFRSDYVLQHGDAPFDHVERGDEPPDFYVETNEARERFDCASFANERRRNAYRLMAHLRTRLVRESEGRDFSGVEGCVLFVWFGPTLEELPPRRTDDEIVEPLLDAIESCRVDREALARLGREIVERGFPQVMPPVIATGRTPDNSAGFVAQAVTTPEQAATFSTGLAFDVQLSGPLLVRASDAIARCQTLVSKHDKEEQDIHHLLITAGGPDRTGIRYPGEEAARASWLADHGGTRA